MSSVKEYQEKFVEISKARFREDYSNHRKLIKHLAGEVVELQEAITETLGLTMAKRTRIIGGEIADCIACCMVAADVLGVDLEKALEEKINEKSSKTNDGFLQGAELLASCTKETRLFYEVEKLFGEVLLPFRRYMGDGKEFQAVKKMIEDVEIIDELFIYELALFLLEVGCPVFEYENLGNWIKTLKEYKAKEKELRLICGGKE